MTELSVPAELLRKTRLSIREEGHLGDIEVGSHWGFAHIPRRLCPAPPPVAPLAPPRAAKLQASPTVAYWPMEASL